MGGLPEGVGHSEEELTERADVGAALVHAVQPLQRPTMLP